MNANDVGNVSNKGTFGGVRSSHSGYSLRAYIVLREKDVVTKFWSQFSGSVLLNH